MGRVGAFARIGKFPSYGVLLGPADLSSAFCLVSPSSADGGPLSSFPSLDGLPLSLSSSSKALVRRSFLLTSGSVPSFPLWKGAIAGLCLGRRVGGEHDASGIWGIEVSR